MAMSIILTRRMVSWVDMYIQTDQSVHFKYVHFRVSYTSIKYF